jgi:ABC-2 type transport system ATP-binding protein
MDKSILSVNSVVKQFASITAVNNLSFNVREREIFALLGPNGAGKTTMVRMLLDIIKPDRGSILYRMGKNSHPNPVEIGYLPEERGLYQDIPVLKTLTYFGIIRGMDRNDAKQQAIEWLERVELKDRMYEKVQSLSKGNQQKIQFIASVVHKPKFAALDEPFSGFDPVNQDLFSRIIRDLCDNGTTILLSAHQMQLVERIADRILLMNNGREVLSGSLNEIRKASGAGNKITVQTDGVNDLSVLHKHPSVQKIESINAENLVIYVHPDKGYSDLLKTLGAHFNVQSIHSEQMSLHDIYLKAINSPDKKRQGH